MWQLEGLEYQNCLAKGVEGDRNQMRLQEAGIQAPIPLPLKPPCLSSHASAKIAGRPRASRMPTLPFQTEEGLLPGLHTYVQQAKKDHIGSFA